MFQDMTQKMKKPISDEHRMNLSLALMGNQNGKGKNLNNKNALGKVSGSNNGNWKGGTSNYSLIREIKAGSSRPDKCGICFEVCKPDFDHCHKTNQFRGWLCRRCNLVLGMVKDDTELLGRLATYLINNDNNSRPKNILNALFRNISDTEIKESNQED